MVNLFSSVISMSITASYVIIFVIVVRLFLKKVPKIFSYILWSVVLFRLICPISFESNLSFLPQNNYGIIENNMNFSSENTGNYENNTNIENDNYKSDNLINNESAILNNKTNSTFILATIWILAILTMSIYSVITMRKLKHKLKSAEYVKDNIYYTKDISTPFVIGILNPKIYIPKGLSDIEERYIITHERIHIKRYDYIIKPIAYFILCIHCFNPLVWIAFMLMSNDMEMSCDEAVIKEMGNSIKKEYSFSLLSLATNKRILSGSPLAFGEGDVKGRVKNILNYKKPTFWIIIISVLLILTVGIGLISNPKGKDNINIYEIMNDILESDEAILRNNGNGATIINGESFNDIVNSSVKGINDWIEGKESLVKGLTPTLEIYINVGDLEYIRFYESNKEVATISVNGKKKTYTIPNEIYEKVQFLYLTRSYHIPEEIIKAIVDGEKTSKISVQDSPINVEYNVFSVGEITYYIYKEKNKYYIEMPYVFINEISEDIYNDAVKFVTDESSINEYEEKSYDDISTEVSESTKFSKDEIKEAIECVKNNFSFPACKLKKVIYDEEKSNYLIDSYIETGGGSEKGVNAENVIILLSSFDVDGTGKNPVLNPNTTYTDYQWILVRDNENSSWVIESWGY